jgi:hypothetical protein
MGVRLAGTQAYCQGADEQTPSGWYQCSLPQAGGSSCSCSMCNMSDEYPRIDPQVLVTCKLPCPA